VTKFTEYLTHITEGIHDKGIFKACFMSGSAACFDEKTLVLTNDGYKPMKDIKTGDKVLTMNEKTKQNEWNDVEELLEFDNDKEILEIEFENGETVICTEDHKFYINDQWVEAKDL
jgi:intein/homing endonuclease